MKFNKNSFPLLEINKFVKSYIYIYEKINKIYSGDQSIDYSDYYSSDGKAFLADTRSEINSMIIRIFTLADSAVARLQWDHGVTIVTDTANQSESCRIAVSQYIMLAGEDTGEDTGEGGGGLWVARLLVQRRWWISRYGRPIIIHIFRITSVRTNLERASAGHNSSSSCHPRK